MPMKNRPQREWEEPEKKKWYKSPMLEMTGTFSNLTYVSILNKKITFITFKDFKSVSS